MDGVGGGPAPPGLAPCLVATRGGATVRLCRRTVVKDPAVAAEVVNRHLGVLPWRLCRCHRKGALPRRRRSHVGVGAAERATGVFSAGAPAHGGGRDAPLERPWMA